MQQPKLGEVSEETIFHGIIILYYLQWSKGGQAFCIVDSCDNWIVLFYGKVNTRHSSPLLYSNTTRGV